MPVNKLRQLDQDTAGVTLPKQQLDDAGVLDDQGNVDGEHHVVISENNRGQWTVELVENL